MKIHEIFLIIITITIYIYKSRAFVATAVGGHVGIAGAGIIVTGSARWHTITASTARATCPLAQPWPR
uniref:Uncharacterized protein n=1 Tax=Cannabis sativa TaxID=3483 RepID=A0A803QWK6_CANSA